MIDRVTDVRNVGAMARTAACAGVHAIIIPIKAPAQLNADAIKICRCICTTFLVCREKISKLTIEYLKGQN